MLSKQKEAGPHLPVSSHLRPKDPKIESAAWGTSLKTRTILGMLLLGSQSRQRLMGGPSSTSLKGIRGLQAFSPFPLFLLGHDVAMRKTMAATCFPCSLLLAPHTGVFTKSFPEALGKLVIVLSLEVSVKYGRRPWVWEGACPA